MEKCGFPWRTEELFLTKGNLTAWKTKAVDVHSVSLSESKWFALVAGALSFLDTGKPRLPSFF